MASMSGERHLVASRQELEARGWAEVDVCLVTGDANVDHPSFPANLLGRVLESEGYRVGILARPDVSDPGTVAVLGRPRLFFAVTAGALDSMVANYTANRRRRSDDPYAPGGQAGGRPDRAVTVYCQMIRRAFGPSVLIVAGGLEASLRSLAHYDFWTGRVHGPLLTECGADFLVRGMGELPLLELARRADRMLSANRHRLRDKLWEELASIPGTVSLLPSGALTSPDAVELPSWEDIRRDRRTHARGFALQEGSGSLPLIQRAGGGVILANGLPAVPASCDLDRWYGLPFTRNPHPMYGNARIPALEQVRFSITSHRGCPGGCSFCAITHHQGKSVLSRSEASVLGEIGNIAAHPDFRGTVPDIGGPSANLYGAVCTRPGGCLRPSCLWPSLCRHLSVPQDRYLALLQNASKHPGVRHLFVTTGVRMDVALRHPAFIDALAAEHTSGHLKVAPEHCASGTLSFMRKPDIPVFDAFLERFQKASSRAGRQQYVLPYMMAAHPGSTLQDAVAVYEFLRQRNLRVEQCQIFTPTPGTRSTVMYATGLVPETLEEIFVERTVRGKEMQKALILHHLPASRPLIREALGKGRGKGRM
jgi:uncharacterized radical SAM protein YgiQ